MGRTGLETWATGTALAVTAASAVGLPLPTVTALRSRGNPCLPPPSPRRPAPFIPTQPRIDPPRPRRYFAPTRRGGAGLFAGGWPGGGRRGSPTDQGTVHEVGYLSPGRRSALRGGGNL